MAITKLLWIDKKKQAHYDLHETVSNLICLGCEPFHRRHIGEDDTQMEIQQIHTTTCSLI